MTIYTQSHSVLLGTKVLAKYWTSGISRLVFIKNYRAILFVRSIYSLIFKH